MYVYYEHIRDAQGQLILTELRLSSRGDGSLWINIKDSIENLKLKLCVPILKQPPSTVRSFDNDTKVWSYTGTTGEAVLMGLKAVCANLIGGIGLVEVEDLTEQCRSGRIRLDRKRQKPLGADEFFYNHGTPTAKPLLTTEQIADRLMVLMELEPTKLIDKSAYRKAALRLHPDRNNGDGSKMSELNMLWGLYNA